MLKLFLTRDGKPDFWDPYYEELFAKALLGDEFQSLVNCGVITGGEKKYTIGCDNANACKQFAHNLKNNERSVVLRVEDVDDQRFAYDCDMDLATFAEKCGDQKYYVFPILINPYSGKGAHEPLEESDFE